MAAEVIFLRSTEGRTKRDIIINNKIQRTSQDKHLGRHGNK
jgi:hypothetical protein